MSSTRQAVVRAPSLTGDGYLPDLTPAHHEDLLTGMIGGVGGVDFGLPIICDRRRKPVLGIVIAMMNLLRLP